MPTLNTNLAFCNDCDFGAWNTYQEVRSTFHALGLPFEDSFWLFDPHGSDFGLFKSNLREKGPKHDELLEEIAAGRLTVLHGGANLDNGAGLPEFRANLAAGLEYLKTQARIPRIWTNHGDENNRQNIGYGPLTHHAGDNPGAEAYCLDILLHYGLEYFWTDADYDNEHFCLNPVVIRARAQNGQSIFRFRRFRGPLPKAPDAQTLSWQLREEHLAELERAKGCTILYQHWHVHRTGEGRPYTAASPVFPADSHARLARLAQKHAAGHIQVMPLADLLAQRKTIDVANN